MPNKKTSDAMNAAYSSQAVCSIFELRIVRDAEDMGCDGDRHYLAPKNKELYKYSKAGFQLDEDFKFLDKGMLTSGLGNSITSPTP